MDSRSDWHVGKIGPYICNSENGFLWPCENDPEYSTVDRGQAQCIFKCKAEYQLDREVGQRGPGILFAAKRIGTHFIS